MNVLLCTLYEKNNLGNIYSNSKILFIVCIYARNSTYCTFILINLAFLENWLGKLRFEDKTQRTLLLSLVTELKLYKLNKIENSFQGFFF